MDAVPRLARAAAQRIAAGALNGHALSQLARELGVSERHLRRAMEREIGVSPLALAQTHRLLLAKRLLADTALPVTRIAFASGFRSLRRFNSVFRERYGLSPSALRPRGVGRREYETVRLTLAYRPPFAWDVLIALLAREALPGVEVVRDGRYARTVRLPGEPHRSRVPSVAHHFHTRQRLTREQGDQHVPRERWPVRERQANRLVFASAYASRSQRAGAQSVALTEHRVEAPQAAEAAGESDPRHRQRGIGEQPLCEQQAMRLRQRERGDSDLALHGPPQVALAHPELPCQLGQGVPVQRAGSDPLGGGARQARYGVHLRSSGCELGAAAQAGTETRALRQRRRLEEAPVAGARHARGADRPTVHPRRRDSDEEDAVEARVARAHGALADVGGEHRYR